MGEREREREREREIAREGREGRRDSRGLGSFRCCLFASNFAGCAGNGCKIGRTQLRV